jgi:hypothetical protein
MCFKTQIQVTLKEAYPPPPFLWEGLGSIAEPPEQPGSQVQATSARLQWSFCKCFNTYTTNIWENGNHQEAWPSACLLLYSSFSINVIAQMPGRRKSPWILGVSKILNIKYIPSVCKHRKIRVTWEREATVIHRPRV